MDTGFDTVGGGGSGDIGGGSSGGSGASALASFAGGLAGSAIGGGGGGGGSGASAAARAAGLKAAVASARASQQLFALHAAQTQAASIPAIFRPTILTQLAIPAVKIAATINQLLQRNRTARQTHKAQSEAAALQRKEARILRAQPPQYIAVAGYGPNSGPPVVGSSDYYAAPGAGGYTL